jgi:hypothetical protein
MAALPPQNPVVESFPHFRIETGILNNQERWVPVVGWGLVVAGYLS